VVQEVLAYLYKRYYIAAVEPSLGTQLRHLIELLDGAVEAAYTDAGLHYRPRYTPVMRALMEAEPLTVGQIAETAGITQPAATQTITLMLGEGLVSAKPGPRDGRQKLIRLTETGRDMLPRLQKCWQATAAAGRSLDGDLPHPLSRLVGQSIDALAAKSFAERIREARAKLPKGVRRAQVRTAAESRAGGVRRETP
jgi:MarR family transcriptional regulator, organic hydroperoxide resistance regulator